MPKSFKTNMLLANSRATSSTFDHVDFGHCVFSKTGYFNSLVAESNIEGAAFAFCKLDATVFQNSSLRHVSTTNCDIKGLTINGIDIQSLLMQIAELLEKNNA